MHAYRPFRRAQDMLHALILSEGVYKAIDEGEEAATEAIDRMQAETVPSHANRLQAVQWSQPHVSQRCVVHVPSGLA